MRSFFIFSSLLLYVISGAGCSSYWVRTPVVEEKNIVVSLEHQVLKDQIISQNFAHPFDMDRNCLEAFLHSLTYLEEPLLPGEAEEKPVFQKAEVERLVPALCQALGKASSDERVRFVSNNKGGGLLFKKPRKTTGIMFVETGGRLNLAFGLVNYEIRISEMETFSQKEEVADPLKIKSSFTPVIPPDFARHRRAQDGTVFPLWVAADIKDIPQTAASVKSVAKETVETSEESARANAGSQTKMAVEKPAQFFEKEKKPLHEGHSEEAGRSWKTRRQENRKKLEYLKELYESDLIDEEEYKIHKKRLLEQL